MCEAAMSLDVTFEPKEIDRAILEILEDGRNVPANIAEELGKSRQYVHQRLGLLEAAERVENVGRGVYELVEAPDEESSDTDTRETLRMDVDAVRRALDDLEGALERGDRREVRAALQRARDALETGG